MFRDYLLLLSWFSAVQAGEIGYFWHITDIHYDPTYYVQGSTTVCSNTKNSLNSRRIRIDRKLGGIFGDYNCDSPWALIESAAKAMGKNRGIEFVLWTGDALSHTAAMTGEQRLQCLQNLTDLLSHTFKEQFVFPALGHEDAGLNFTQLAQIWKHWLPTEALNTFEKGGYYTIELQGKKYRIIFLNTNLWLNVEPLMDSRGVHRTNGHVLQNTEDPLGQWSWLESTLATARKKEETVYIVGHTPPGVNDRESGAATLNEWHNEKYLHVVRHFADIIRGQFFGHWHSDTFRVVYDDAGQAVSWIMMAPSITPYSPGGPNNPGLRLYEFEKNTGQVLDYTQYYLNLREANAKGKAEWQPEYSLLKLYELKEITAISLDDLADRLTQPKNHAFMRYYKANTVSLPDEVERDWGCGAFNGACRRRHYCTVRWVSTASYEYCYATYPHALASRGSTGVRVHPLLLLLVLLSCVKLLENR